MIPRGIVILVSLGALGACGGGSPMAEDLEPARARLHVVATFVDSMESYVDIHAWLVPGVMEGGRVREVVDPTLGIIGQEVEPNDRGGQPGELVYRYRWPLEPGTIPETVLTIDPPRVTGVTPSFGPVRWLTFGRGDPFSIPWSTDEDLVLSLEAPTEGSTPPPGAVQADLTLYGSGGSLTVLRASLPPVNPIVVPKELMPVASGSSIRATLSLRQGRDAFLPGEEYEIVSSMEVRVSWEIRVEAPRLGSTGDLTLRRHDAEMRP